MPRVLVIAQVKDPKQWEKGFRTHGKLFRSMSVTKAVEYGLTDDGKTAATCFEAKSLAKFSKSLNSPAVAEAMDFDGVMRETVQVYVLKKKFKP